MNSHDVPSVKMGVLGIGMVMEEVGKGARLVFRYPSSPPPYFMDNDVCGEENSPHSHSGKTNNSSNMNKKCASLGGNIGGVASRSLGHNRKGNSTGHPSTHFGTSNSRSSIDLFFDLPARVVSKLFRPKRPLCGQPLTLNVSGTTFCCRAELFDPQSFPLSVGGALKGENRPDHPLVLFSVIVALAPLRSRQYNLGESSSLSASSTFQNVSNYSDRNAHCQHPYTSTHRINAAFTTIKRVHRSLARICKVLTREELRCQYVTLQCQMLISIRKEYEENLSPVSESSGLNSGGINDVSHSSSGKKEEAGLNSLRRISNTSVSNLGGTQISPNENRIVGPPPCSSNSDSTEITSVYVTDDTENILKKLSPIERREYDQNLIDVMLAASPPNRSHGNLARELAQVFHLLSKHDDPGNPISVSEIISRTSAKDGVVYINRHVAVPLELDDSAVMRLPDHFHSLSNKPSREGDEFHQNAIRVWPFHTLLFPSSSPSEILRDLLGEDNNAASAVSNIAIMSTPSNVASTSDSLVHTLCRILSYLHPRKNLEEVAWDSSLSLTLVLQAAQWLVNTGICVAAMPVLRNNRYACAERVVEKMSSLALPFWQEFGLRCEHCKFCLYGEGKSDSPKRITTGAPHIFIVVSALTTTVGEGHAAAPPKLGEAIHSLTEINESDSASYQRRKFSSIRGAKDDVYSTVAGLSQKRINTEGDLLSSRGKHPIPHGPLGPTSQNDDSLSNDILYSMTIWLLAHKVLVDVKEYLVVIKSPRVRSVDDKNFTATEETLFHELLDLGYLNGMTSIPAITFQLGIDRLRMDRFVRWGHEKKVLESIFRVANSTDDSVIT